jgi:hypothetical protein
LKQALSRAVLTLLFSNFVKVVAGSIVSYLSRTILV